METVAGQAIMFGRTSQNASKMKKPRL